MLLTLAQSPPPDVAATAVLFWVLAAISGASAVGVVVSRNIVRTSVCLLFTLLGVAGLYFLLGAEFLAAVQLVVYAGGTLILIVFGVMLTSNAPSVSYQPSRGEILIALLVGSLMFSSLAFALVDWTHLQGFPTKPAPALANPSPGTDPVASLGVALLGDYLLPFELVSVVLLVVMIGAAYLAKARRPDSATAPREAQR
jgi:NADH-quinone oxidoreductase subunit J